VIRFRQNAFTIIELLIVMTIIIILAGLVLGTSGYVQKKGARSRAEAEIAAISAGLESYKADNGIYPSDPNTTDQLDPTAPPPANNSTYINAAQALYRQLSGDQDGVQNTLNDDTKNYISALIKPGSLATPSGQIPYLKDPFGNPYGYSTMKASNPSSHGFNPTFDLWSTANTPADQNQWIKNW
jgi:type II secretory pathway pseudopilin PulG